MIGFPGFLSGRVSKADKATQTELVLRTFKFRATYGTKVTFYNIAIKLLRCQLQNKQVDDFLTAVQSANLLPSPKQTDEKRDEPLVSNVNLQMGPQQTEQIDLPNDIVLIDVSEDETDSESGVDDGPMNVDECAVCRGGEPDTYIVGCRHAFCSSCLNTIKKSKKLKCPKCSKGWRKTLPLDGDWSALDGRPKNRCQICEKGPLNRILSCGHLYCNDCIDKLKTVEGRPRCPKCNVRFIKSKSVFF